jgi:hypothetical protein
MTHPYIRAALGRERLNTLLADAEAARTARQARQAREPAQITQLSSGVGSPGGSRVAGHIGDSCM